MLWASPRFGLSPQDLYVASIANDDQATVRDLEEDDDIVVVAAQTDRPLRETPAVPGETCLVTTNSVAPSPIIGWSGCGRRWLARPPKAGKTWIALSILALVIAAGSFGMAPIEPAAVAGATLMVMTRVLTPRSAVRALNWNILAIIAGSVGLGTIVVNSGLGDYISGAVLSLSGENTFLVVVAIAVGTTVLTNVVTNSAAAAIGVGIAVRQRQGVRDIASGALEFVRSLDRRGGLGRDGTSGTSRSCAPPSGSASADSPGTNRILVTK